MEIYIKKINGIRQLFDRDKIIRTCLRMGANRITADKIVREVEQQLYDDMPTKKILKLIFSLLKKYKPTINHLLDLRMGLSLMASKPEFEKFVQILLTVNDFKVTPNRLLMGKCVKHEVDGIAQKNGLTYLVEVKHHKNYHSPTGLDESRIARAVFEEVTDGYKLGKNNIRIDRAMIVTNTRFSEYAKIYGKCRNILQIGWSSPKNMQLQNMIEEKKAYPLSCIKGINHNIRAKLVNSGVVLIRQLMNANTSDLSRKSGVSKSTLRKIIEKTKDSPFWV